MDFLSIITDEKISAKFNTIYSPFVIEPYWDDKKDQADSKKEPGVSSIDRKSAQSNISEKPLRVIGIFMPMRY